MKEYDAYLFDADGTLMDTRELIVQSFLHMGGVLGVELSPALIQGTIGLPVATQLPMLVGEGRGAEYYERARTLYNDFMMDHLDDCLRAFPGAVEMVGELHRRGKKLAVVTSRKLPSTVLFLERIGLKDFFSHFVTPECTEKHKPNPEPAVFAMEKLGAKPEHTLFVGDAAFDIECGHAAGTDTAYVVWGGMDTSSWSVQPDWTLNTFHDLLA